MPTDDSKKGHFVRRTLHEAAHYPPHEPDREKDPYYHLFHKTRHHLIEVLQVPCWIGGATAQQIRDGLPEGHPCHGATGLELHHSPLEYAGLSEVDWRKYAAEFPEAGVHSDEDLRRVAQEQGNATILCSIHHRSPHKGIHWITGPLWLLMKFENDGWDFCPDPGTEDETKDV